MAASVHSTRSFSKVLNLLRALRYLGNIDFMTSFILIGEVKGMCMVKTSNAAPLLVIPRVNENKKK